MPLFSRTLIVLMGRESVEPVTKISWEPMMNKEICDLFRAAQRGIYCLMIMRFSGSDWRSSILSKLFSMLSKWNLNIG